MVRVGHCLHGHQSSKRLVASDPAPAPHPRPLAQKLPSLPWIFFSADPEKAHRSITIGKPALTSNVLCYIIVNSAYIPAPNIPALPMLPAQMGRSSASGLGSSVPPAQS